MTIRLRRPSWAKLQALGVPLFLRALAWLPLPIVEETLGLVALTQVFLEPSRARRAFAWAASHPEAGKGKWRLALALFLNRGRFLAMAASPARMTPESFLRRVVLEGIDHLEAAAKQGGTILLGFHLGPTVPAWAVYAFTAPIRGWQLHPDPLVRGAGLYRVRRLLLAGRTVYITADGQSGNEVFRIAVPGGQVVVKGGWWILRRQTGAVTLPMFARRQGPQVVVTVHPALPTPIPDPHQDLAACRGALSRHLQEYVRRFPEQCVSLAFGSRGSGESSANTTGRRGGYAGARGGDFEKEAGVGSRRGAREPNRTEGRMEILDLKGSLEFSPERHVHTIVAETPLCSISVVGWEPGQTSPIHSHPGADEIYHVLEGEGLFNDGRTEVRLGPGDTVIFPAGEAHRVQALTRMVLYRVQAGADRHPEPLDAWPAP